MALVGDERSAPRPDCIITREIAPDTYCIGDWVGPRIGVEVVKRISYL
jgi:hypothetical protein